MNGTDTIHIRYTLRNNVNNLRILRPLGAQPPAPFAHEGGGSAEPGVTKSHQKQRNTVREESNPRHFVAPPSCAKGADPQSRGLSCTLKLLTLLYKRGWGLFTTNTILNLFDYIFHKEALGTYVVQIR